MPTIAPWKGPGDVLPVFTLAMFEHTPQGAMATAKSYADARNWAVATLNPTPILLLCQSDSCKQSGEMISRYAAKRQHIVGARQVLLDRTLLRARDGSGAEWVVRAHLLITKGAVINPSGSIAQTQPQLTQLNDLYLRWNGKLWVVQDDALAPKGTK